MVAYAAGVCVHKNRTACLVLSASPIQVFCHQRQKGAMKIKVDLWPTMRLTPAKRTRVRELRTSRPSPIVAISASAGARSSEKADRKPARRYRPGICCHPAPQREDQSFL
jgi:hypothetical protein